MQLKYFKEHEFFCKCGCGKGKLTEMNPHLLQKLDLARDIAQIPFNVNSGARCEQHNQQCKGSPNSEHIECNAVDIHCIDSVARYKILTACLAVGIKRIGIAPTFIHLDCKESTPLIFLYK